MHINKRQILQFCKNLVTSIKYCGCSFINLNRYFENYVHHVIIGDATAIYPLKHSIKFESHVSMSQQRKYLNFFSEFLNPCFLKPVSITDT